MGCEITASGSGMDISAMAGSGLQIDITGDDLDTLRRIAGDIAALVEGTPAQPKSRTVWIRQVPKSASRWIRKRPPPTT